MKTFELSVNRQVTYSETMKLTVNAEDDEEAITGAYDIASSFPFTEVRVVRCVVRKNEVLDTEIISVEIDKVKDDDDDAPRRA